jgi:hypothetical protein
MKMIKMLLVITLIEGMILGPFQTKSSFDEDIYSIFFIIMNFFLLLFILAKKLPMWFYKTIFAIYSIKIILLIFMYFNIDTVMNALSIWDVYAFYQPQAIDYIHGNTDVQTYSKIVANIYMIFGPFMRIPVFYNIVVSLLADIFFFKTLMELNVTNKSIKMFTIIFMLLPWRNILSMFMLREAIPTFLVVVSIYFFIKWWKQGMIISFIYAITASISSMAFHSGLIAIPVIIMLAYILYNPRKNQWALGFKTMYKLIAILLFSGLIFIAFGDIILYKFAMISSDNETALSEWSVTIINGAQSHYLTSFSYTSFSDIILQAPLRIIYFLLSPMPWDWRGVSDALAFGMDSLVQLLGISLVFKKIGGLSDQYKRIVKVMLCMYILSALIFGAGTFDAGTAMRHRAKFTLLLLLADAVCIASKEQTRSISKAANR